jgi:gas vesicle protein
VTVTSAFTKELKHALHQREDDGIMTFVTGLLLGLLGGTIVGLLFAPRSGQALRVGTYRVLRDLPGRVNDEFTISGTRTRDLIDKTRHNIESQVGKARRDRKADQMAKAKRAEELASGYEFN